MTALQRAALTRLTAADVPLPLHAATGTSLERLGLAERVGDRWRATERGEWQTRVFAHDEAVAAVHGQMSAEQRDLAQRAHHWLQAHALLEDVPAVAYAQVRHAIDAYIVGAAADLSPRLADEWAEYIAVRAHAAVDCLRHFADVLSQAERAGGNVVVDYTVADARPDRATERRREAIVAARRESGAIDLTIVRERW